MALGLGADRPAKQARADSPPSAPRFVCASRYCSACELASSDAAEAAPRCGGGARQARVGTTPALGGSDTRALRPVMVSPRSSVKHVFSVASTVAISDGAAPVALPCDSQVVGSRLWQAGAHDERRRWQPLRRSLRRTQRARAKSIWRVAPVNDLTPTPRWRPATSKTARTVAPRRCTPHHERADAV